MGGPLFHSSIHRLPVSPEVVSSDAIVAGSGDLAASGLVPAALGDRNLALLQGMKRISLADDYRKWRRMASLNFLSIRALA